MAECRYFPECQRCNETGDSWIPCAGGSDGTRCYGYEPMPDVDALTKLADEMDEVAQRRRSMGYEGFAIGDEDRARRIREALGVQDA